MCVCESSPTAQKRKYNYLACIRNNGLFFGNEETVSNNNEKSFSLITLATTVHFK